MPDISLDDRATPVPFLETRHMRANVQKLLQDQDTRGAPGTLRRVGDTLAAHLDAFDALTPVAGICPTNPGW